MSAFQITPPSAEVEREEVRRALLALRPATPEETFRVLCMLYPAPTCNQN